MPIPTRKALLEFYLTDTALYTFVVRPNIPELNIEDEQPIVITAAVTSEEVKTVVRKIRMDYEEIRQYPNQNFTYSLKDFFDLGRKIFTPELCTYITHFDALYIVPFGPLHYLPIHAFKIDDHYLIDRFQISYLPSASVLQFFTKDRANISKRSILLLGVDATGEEPHFMLETDQIQALDIWNKEGDIYLKGEQCTKSNFFDHCANKSIIHLSTHGFFSDKEPLLSGAQLYRPENYEASDSSVSHTEDSTILSAKDIFERANLNAELVVMSGCVTGDSINKPGDELIGLTRALIYAGANSMIVTLFITFKQITSSYSTTDIRFAKFYDLWIGQQLSKGAAFQQFIQNIKRQERYQHPYYWFSYIMVGSLD